MSWMTIFRPCSVRDGDILVTMSTPTLVLTQPTIQLVTEGFFPKVTEVEHETHHSLPSCDEVKNEWSFTSTPPWHMLQYRDNFTFQFTNVWPVYMQSQATWFTLHTLMKCFIDYVNNGIFNKSAQSGMERNHNTLQCMECGYWRIRLKIIMETQPAHFLMSVNKWGRYKKCY
jgi:hypothetical protein